jgi:hypothetical protein
MLRLMSLESTMRAAFDGVNAYDADAIMKVWNPDGVYDNPTVGPAAQGFDAVRACMVRLCDGVRGRGQQLVVDRVTTGASHVVAEWHVEPATGAKGVHVAEFDDAGRLRHVTVYPRA